MTHCKPVPGISQTSDGDNPWHPPYKSHPGQQQSSVQSASSSYPAVFNTKQLRITTSSAGGGGGGGGDGNGMAEPGGREVQAVETDNTAAGDAASAFVSVVRENGTAVEMNGNRRDGDETPSRRSTAETRVINDRNADSEILTKEQNNEYGNQSQKKTRAREEKNSQIESWTPKATRATKPEVDRAAPEVASSIGHRLTRSGEKLTVGLETARLADSATEKTTPTEER